MCYQRGSVCVGEPGSDPLDIENARVDMKTPLVAIGGFALLVQRHLEAGDPYRDKLDIVVRETARLEKLVKEMLDFSRPLVLNLSEETVHLLIEESIALVEELARGKNVTVRNASSPSIPAVPIDGMRMKQVLINLITNAIQASPEGEIVKVACGINEGEMVIDVIDHGHGIPRDKMDEIFSPFVTTKKDGTGLGLSIVKKIVETHKGHMAVLDGSERGTILRVVFPAVLL